MGSLSSQFAYNPRAKPHWTVIFETGRNGAGATVTVLAESFAKKHSDLVVLRILTVTCCLN